MLRKEFRVTKKRDFEKIRKRGKFFSNNTFSINFAPNHLTFSRIAVVVKKKLLKKATLRNHLKRQIREIIRINFKKIRPGFDIIIIPKIDITSWEFKKMESELLETLKKAEIL